MTHPQRILRYKYVPFDDGARCIIRDATVKFTRPSDFNDPFDCAPYVDPRSASRSASRNKELMRRAGKARGLSPAGRLLARGKMLRALERAVEQGRFGQPAVDSAGVFCLSRDPLNLLMWAHYAINHTGIVMEFDIPLTEESDPPPTTTRICELLVPHVVDYSSERPTIDMEDDPYTNTTKHVLVKGLEWKHEQEERVIDHERGFGILPYDRAEVLRSVIAGIRMSDPDFEELKSLVQNTNDAHNLDIKVYRAHASERTYELTVPERPDLCMGGEKPNKTLQSDA